jgi:hypothetical protein
MFRFTIAVYAAGALAVMAIVGIALTTTPMPRSHMQVLESNAREYPVGRRLVSNTAFKLQKGERVKVLLLPSNRTQVFEGPPADEASPMGGSRGID